MLVPTASPGALLATCSADSTVRLWALGGAGRLSALTAVDLRARLRPAGARLLCLAASPDGQLLAAGGWLGRCGRKRKAKWVGARGS